jgi:meso-butanediol dehydrogenase / (S,S)-butanediol dehydrogenase / diacetyl reductase
MGAEFSGKRILVTGSTRGIGRATAELLHERGGEVIWHGRTRDAALRSAAEAGGGLAVGCDLADRVECRRIAAEAGEVDVLVNCAGIFLEAPIAQTSETLWDDTIAANLTAAWTLSRALLLGLRRRHGVIVNVASDAGLLGYPGCAAYCASKGALIGLTRALAVELAPDVRAVAVCPGPVETDMMHDAIAAAVDPEAARRNWSAATMLRRPATANEIAEAIAFAASPRASYMTGDLLVIAGGATAGRRVGG